MPSVIATAALGDAQAGVALVDPGPAVSLPALRAALAGRGLGVGDVTALTWALEIDIPYRFSSVKDVQSYCGLCAAQHESGSPTSTSTTPAPPGRW